MSLSEFQRGGLEGDPAEYAKAADMFVRSEKERFYYRPEFFLYAMYHLTDERDDPRTIENEITAGFSLWRSNATYRLMKNPTKVNNRLVDEISFLTLESVYEQAVRLWNDLERHAGSLLEDSKGDAARILAAKWGRFTYRVYSATLSAK